MRARRGRRRPAGWPNSNRLATLFPLEPQGPKRRFLARPRRFGTGFAVSVAIHAGLVFVFLAVWSLLPLPPIQPIRIHLLPDAPSRSEIGVEPDGRPGPEFGPP